MTIASGSAVSLWRYPVKSMMGEALESARIGPGGLVGDRVHALIDRETGRVASAKNPAKWGRLMQCRAELLGDASAGAAVVRIVLPDGRAIRSDDDGVNRTLSDFVEREVTLASLVPVSPRLEEYSPDMEELPERDVTTESAMAEGTFFDVEVIHLLTTATLQRLRAIYPEGQLDVRRFRPNIVVEPVVDREGFVEDDWTGHTASIGTGIQLEVTQPCPRCVMTTLPQGELPRDPGVLRATAQFNDLNAGVYAAVREGGTVNRLDPVVVH